MASNTAYQVRGVPGEVNVFPLGSATAPSIAFGNPNMLGGLNDGFYATSAPSIILVLDGVAVSTWTSSGMAGAAAVTSSSPTSAVGYATGAGGAVTQGTSKATGVTLNTVTGAITLNNASLAADAIATFTVTNSAVGVNDVIAVNHGSAGTPGIYNVLAHSITAGSFGITLHNFSGTAAAEAIVLNFAVISGVQA